MTETPLDAIGVFALLRQACATAGGQKAWSEANGVSHQYVNDVLNGRTGPGEKILDALGLVRLPARYVSKRD